MKSLLILQHDSVANRVLTFSNSLSDSELIWLYKCSQLPRDLDTGTGDISISLTDVILITLNCLTLCYGFTCFFFFFGEGKGGFWEGYSVVFYLLTIEAGGKAGAKHWKSFLKCGFSLF